jgi:hypothetical protein
MDILSSSDSSESDKVEDLEALKERQFRQEMDDYGRYIARAYEIAEKDC